MSLFTLFGIRFGWSSIIGLIPWLGDVFDLYFAYAVVQICQQVSSDPSHNPSNLTQTHPSRQDNPKTAAPTGLPAFITSKMYTNVAIDFALGLVPFLGDLADASFKCNTKNVALLERYLIEKHAPQSMSQNDRARSGLEVFPEDAGMVPGLEGVGQGQGQGHAQYGAVHAPQQQGMRREEPEQRGAPSSGRGWFGVGGGKTQGRSDVEQGRQQEKGTIPVRQ